MTDENHVDTTDNHHDETTDDKSEKPSNDNPRTAANDNHRKLAPNVQVNTPTDNHVKLTSDAANTPQTLGYQQLLIAMVSFLVLVPREEEDDIDLLFVRYVLEQALKPYRDANASTEALDMNVKRHQICSEIPHLARSSLDEKKESSSDSSDEDDDDEMHDDENDDGMEYEEEMERSRAYQETWYKLLLTVKETVQATTGMTMKVNDLDNNEALLADHSNETQPPGKSSPVAAVCCAMWLREKLRQAESLSSGATSGVQLSVSWPSNCTDCPQKVEIVECDLPKS
ncbi:MAG: hypothetical protein Q9204_007703 [Flavoplaca sp. TL-2023a]